MSEDLKPLPFEKGLETLDGIVQKLEGGEISLEESVQLFERGVRLSRDLRKQLDAAESRVEILMKKDGDHVPKPFDLADSG